LFKVEDGSGLGVENRSDKVATLCSDSRKFQGTGPRSGRSDQKTELGREQKNQAEGGKADKRAIKIQHDVRAARLTRNYVFLYRIFENCFGRQGRHRSRRMEDKPSWKRRPSARPESGRRNGQAKTSKRRCRNAVERLIEERRRLRANKI